MLDGFHDFWVAVASAGHANTSAEIKVFLSVIAPHIVSFTLDRDQIRKFHNALEKTTSEKGKKKRFKMLCTGNRCFEI